MIGIIGGSGFYDFLEDPQDIQVNTPHGEVRFERGKIEGHELVFLPRHGKSHSITPSQINYQANIFGAWKIGVKQILATNAVGSLNPKYQPGDLVVPHDIIDVTRNRNYISRIRGHNNLRKITRPAFHPYVRSLLISALRENYEKVNDGAILAVTSGPRFETPAEIKAYRRLGAELVGMTSAPEAFIASEMGISYATLAVVTNMAAGMQSILSDKEVFDLFNNRIDSVKQIMKSAIAKSENEKR